LEEIVRDRLELRRTNRIWSVHSSTAIEGNQLSLAQVEDVAHGAPVIAPPRDVKEVENALAAYDALDSLDPWDVNDFLQAHRLLTEGLVKEFGAFRGVGVEIVNASGEVLHYLALQASREPEIDAAPFIGYMLDVIEESLVGYEARARSSATDVGLNVGVNVTDEMLRLLRAEPTLSAAALAAKLGKTPRTIERHLRALKSTGAIRRVGSAKTGHWVVAEGEET
jgi:Fic family protein